jgi:hypothetical protein
MYNLIETHPYKQHRLKNKTIPELSVFSQERYFSNFI